MSLFHRVRRSVARTNAAEVQRVRPVDLAFGDQRQAIECHDPFVVFCCSGRSGKSRGAVIKWLEVAERKPGELSCFIALTLAQAMRIAWRQLTRMDKELKLGLTFNKAEHSISHPNGATLILLGANRDDLIDVLRGTPFAFVYFDEAAFFREGLLKAAVEDALLIRMMDLQGEMWVASTPGYVKAGYHYDLVSGQRPGWKLYQWTYFDNPHLPEYPWEPDAVKRRLLRIAFAAKIRETQGWSEDSPSYMREWRGMYCDDIEALVYAFRAELHFVDAMPDSWFTSRDRWHTVIGIDFGSTNATAWTVLAFEKHTPDVYVVETRKEYSMAPSLTADVTKAYIGQYHPDVVIGDSAAKGYIDEHATRHQIAIEGADKQGKRSHQMLLNDAMRAVDAEGLPKPRVYFVRATTASLTDEIVKLGRDPRFGRNHERYGEEDPNAENDACFVAGTLIQAERGAVPIECVRVGEQVWTRQGLRRVMSAGCTGAHLTHEVTTGNGTALTGTANHPVWTQRGWVPLAELTCDDMVTAWESTGQALESCSRASHTVGIRNPAVVTFASTGRRSAETSFTGPYGKRIAALFRTACTFTTSTETRWTTALKIWLLSRRRSTPGSTCVSLDASRNPAQPSPSRNSRPPLGTHPMPVGLGTPRTAAQRLPSALCLASGRAWFAESTSSQSGPKPSFAACAVTQNSGETPALTTSSAHARSAAQRSCVVDMARPSTAQDRVLGVRTRNVERVYNLTVDGVPEYFANGVLVHNCDSWLYGWWKCWAWLEEYAKADADAAERERLSRIDPLRNTALQGVYAMPPPARHEGMRGAFGLPGLRKRMNRK